MSALTEDEMRGGRRTRLSSLRAVEWVNFFAADIQSGVGPFLATYLATRGWSAEHVGFALTFGGLVTVGVQTPAGAAIDDARRKRLLLGVALAACAAGSLLVAGNSHTLAVAAALLLIGLAGAFLMPTLAAITMGLVGVEGFDRQFGRNQGYSSAGNVVAALLLAGVSYWLGPRMIFVASAAMAVPALVALWRINGGAIDFARARGQSRSMLPDQSHTQILPGDKKPSRVQILMGDKVLLLFLGSAFLFHLANAAMLPELGELLSHGRARVAAPFTSACILVTQLVITGTAAWIGRLAATRGRRPLLLLAYGVLPVRAVLYTLTQSPEALIAIQLLDGAANAIFGVVSVLVVADRLRRTGHFNLGQGALGTFVGLGAALSATLGGELVEDHGFALSFLGLGGVAVAALVVLWLGVPETLAAEEEPERVAA